MSRKQIIAFCNEKIFPQVDNPGLDVFETIKLVEKYRHGKPNNMEMIAKVYDGYLTINGEKCGRIAPKMPKNLYSDKAAYWEGKILARQETEV